MAFDPNEHMRTLSGKKYLDVKFRLVWLREDDRKAAIETELVEHITGESAVFKAKVTTSEGAIATGYGSETIKDFRDYLEKAETKAIGRALGALGYGTQFAEDFSYEREEPTVKVVDSPVQPKQSPLVNTAQQNGARVVEPATQPSPTTPNGTAMTEPQKRAIFAIGRGMGYDSEEVEDMCISRHKKRIGSLSKQEATDFIDQLKKLAAEEART